MSTEFNHELFKVRLEQAGLSVRDAAKKLQVAPSVVSRWQNGEIKPRPKRLVLIAKLLKMDAKELITNNGNDSNTD